MEQDDPLLSSTVIWQTQMQHGVKPGLGQAGNCLDPHAEYKEQKAGRREWILQNTACAVNGTLSVCVCVCVSAMKCAAACFGLVHSLYGRQMSANCRSVYLPVCLCRYSVLVPLPSLFLPLFSSHSLRFTRCL